MVRSHQDTNCGSAWHVRSSFPYCLHQVFRIRERRRNIAGAIHRKQDSGSRSRQYDVGRKPKYRNRGRNVRQNGNDHRNGAFFQQRIVQFFDGRSGPDSRHTVLRLRAGKATATTRAATISCIYSENASGAAMTSKLKQGGFPPFFIALMCSN